jgi:CheY-like chemotaxis protein
MVRRVMLIEDNLDLRDTLSDLIEAEGFDVVPMDDPRAALAHLRSGAPHPCLIFLDATLPHMSGAEFRAEQLSDERLARIPIVWLTGSELRDVDEPVIQKPFDIEQILNVLGRCAAG